MHLIVIPSRPSLIFGSEDPTVHQFHANEPGEWRPLGQPFRGLCALEGRKEDAARGRASLGSEAGCTWHPSSRRVSTKGGR